MAADANLASSDELKARSLSSEKLGSDVKRHHANLLSSLSEWLCNDAYTDTSIQSIPCHRLVLAGASSFLEQLLKGVDDAVIYIPGVATECITSALRHIYTGHLTEDGGAPHTGHLTEDSAQVEEILRILQVPLPARDETRLSKRELKQATKSSIEKDKSSPPEAAKENLKMLLPPSCPMDHKLNSELDCAQCDTKFATEAELKLHKQLHTGATLERQKSYKCQNCDEVFRWRSEYKKHSEIVHGIKVIEVKNCELCKKDIVAARYREHIKTVHRKERPLACDVCSKTFPKASDLKNHKRIHSGEKPFVCKDCGARFSISHLLLRHRRYHEGVTKYKCAHCDKAFLQKNDYTKHLRIHTGEKPYKCDDCGAEFARNDYLKKHKHLHQNSEGFPCDVCSLNFSSKESLKKHSKVHKKPSVHHHPDHEGAVLLDMEAVASKSYMYFIHESSGNEALPSAGEGSSLVIPHPALLLPSSSSSSGQDSRLVSANSPVIHAPSHALHAPSPLLSHGAAGQDTGVLQDNGETLIIQDVVGQDPAHIVADSTTEQIILQDEEGRFILPESIPEGGVVLCGESGLDSAEILYTVQY